MLEINDETILDHFEIRTIAIWLTPICAICCSNTPTCLSRSVTTSMEAPGGTVDVIRKSRCARAFRSSRSQPRSRRFTSCRRPRSISRIRRRRRTRSYLPARCRKNWPTAIGRMIAPPGMPLPNTGHPQEHHSHEEARPARVRLDLFFRESFAPGYFDRVFKSFRDALGASSKAGALLWWKAFCGVLFDMVQLQAQARHAGEEGRGDVARTVTTHSLAMVAIRHATSSLSATAGRISSRSVTPTRTRSAHIVIAALGALAVLIAVATLVLPDSRTDRADHQDLCAGIGSRRAAGRGTHLLPAGARSALA